jgi:hypothetical protein
LASQPSAPPPLSAVLEQALALHGAARPEILAGRDGVFSTRRLRIPGWPIGLWDFEEGQPTRLTETPRGPFRLLWLTESGHLLWVIVDTGVFQDDSSLLATDTPGDFYRHVCAYTDVGNKVWTDAVLRLPILARYEVPPIEGLRKGAPAGLIGGPALLIDAPTRAFNGQLLEQCWSVNGAPTSVMNWAVDGGDYEIRGWALASSTDRELQEGEDLGPHLVNAFILTEAGSWIAFTRVGASGGEFQFFDTVEDFYRHLILHQPKDHHFRAMWSKLSLRFSILRKLDEPFLARWTSSR